MYTLAFSGKSCALHSISNYLKKLSTLSITDKRGALPKALDSAAAAYFSLHSNLARLPDSLYLGGLIEYRGPSSRFHAGGWLGDRDGEGIE